MGIGWEYFNNVCLAIKVGYRVVASVVGLLVVWLVGMGVMQYINANRTDPTLIVPPITMPDAPAAKPNPQFKTTSTPGAAAPSNTGVPAAPSLKPNPQFQQPGTTPANAGTSAAPAGLKPNPQFAPNPQFH